VVAIVSGKTTLDMSKTSVCNLKLKMEAVRSVETSVATYKLYNIEKTVDMTDISGFYFTLYMEVI
jgi:hypothetical protein